MRTLSAFGFIVTAATTMTFAVNLFEAGFQASGDKALILCSIGGLCLAGFAASVLGAIARMPGEFGRN
jgi:hypothetical protein